MQLLLTAMVQALPRCAISPEPLLFVQSQLLVYNLFKCSSITSNTGPERRLVMKYLDLHCCICFIFSIMI